MKITDPCIASDLGGESGEAARHVLNIYKGCPCRCLYCESKGFFFNDRNPSKQLTERLERQVKKEKFDSQVLLSWQSDPYSPGMDDDNETTRKALQILSREGIPAFVLTKNLKRALRDVDVFKSFDGKIKVGTSLAFSTNEATSYYEPNVDSLFDRLEALETLRREKIETCVQLKPLINVFHSIRLIEMTEKYADSYLIGGYFGRVLKRPKEIIGGELETVVENVVSKLRRLKKRFYVDSKLRKKCPTIQWEPEESSRSSVWIFKEKTPFWFYE